MLEGLAAVERRRGRVVGVASRAFCCCSYAAEGCCRHCSMHEYVCRQHTRATVMNATPRVHLQKRRGLALPVPPLSRSIELNSALRLPASTATTASDAELGSNILENRVHASQRACGVSPPGAPPTSPSTVTSTHATQPLRPSPAGRVGPGGAGGVRGTPRRMPEPDKFTNYSSNASSPPR